MTRKPTPTTIAEQWRLFEAHVMPRNAPPVQRQEMRRSFYMGAFALLEILSNIPADISDEAGAAILDRIDQEIKAFQSRIGIDR